MAPMKESAREVYGPVRRGIKNPKSVWWNNEVKTAVRRKEAAWKVVLAASNEEAKERCREEYREEKIMAKRCIYIREIIKGGGDRVVDWIWRLYNMTYKSGVMPEPLYKGKGERTECKNYRGIRLLNVVGKI